MRRRRFRWWSKFNFVLSAGLEGGTIFSAVLTFFALQFPRGGTIAVNWWGNDVWQNTAGKRLRLVISDLADYNGTVYLNPPDAGFGPGPDGTTNAF